MSKCAEIEAAIPSLSAEELARIDATLHRVLRARGLDVPPNDAGVRLDGRPWPTTLEEITALLAELDTLPPLLTSEEADRFDAWRVAEKERQKALSAISGQGVGQLFA